MASKRKAAKPAEQRAKKLKLPAGDLLKLFRFLVNANGNAPKSQVQAKKFELDGKLYAFTPRLRKTMEQFMRDASGTDQVQAQATLNQYFTGKGKNPTTRSDLLAKHGLTPKEVTIDRLGSIKVFCVGTWAYPDTDSKGKTVHVSYHDDRIEITKP